MVACMITTQDKSIKILACMGEGLPKASEVLVTLITAGEEESVFFMGVVPGWFSFL